MVSVGSCVRSQLSVLKPLAYSQKLTRVGSDLLCQAVAVEPNLGTSTEAQDALRITDDRPWPGWLPTGCRNGLEETRLGGFFVFHQLMSGHCQRQRRAQIAPAYEPAHQVSALRYDPPHRSHTHIKKELISVPPCPAEHVAA